MIEARRLAIRDVWEIVPVRLSDERGFFSEVWSEAASREAGLDLAFVQDNHSYSAQRGVLRGLHFQRPPFAQGKLIRVLRGAIFDVAVDIRPHSETFGRWVSVIVSAEAWNQVYVPPGFAHGFLTLEPGCEVLYKVTAPYSRDQERTLRFDDDQLAIDWPIGRSDIRLSRKDREGLSLRALARDLGADADRDW